MDRAEQVMREHCLRSMELQLAHYSTITGRCRGGQSGLDLRRAEPQDVNHVVPPPDRQVPAIRSQGDPLRSPARQLPGEVRLAGLQGPGDDQSRWFIDVGLVLVACLPANQGLSVGQEDQVRHRE